jgi:P pilus assembly chaperone PapD
MRLFFVPSARVNLNLLLILLMGMMMPTSLRAEGDLLVAPTRLLFQGSTRAEEIALVNRGSVRATYRISFINKRMLPDGTFADTEQPGDGEAFADPFLRLSQREITLEPGQPQTIRILLRKPEVMADGEYRSHLLFRAVPNAQTPTFNSEQNGISIQLTPVFGLSIPVIIRQGALSAKAEIGRAQLLPSREGTPAAVDVTLQREGSRSIYGDVQLVAEKDRTKIIAEVKGVAVYVPNARRSLRVALTPAQWQQVNGTAAKLLFRESGQSVDPASAERPLEP